MTKYRVTLYKLDSKGKERIIYCKIKNSRAEADTVISKTRAKERPFVIKDNGTYYKLEAL